MRLNRIAPQRHRSSDQLSKWTGLERVSWTALIAEGRTKERQHKTRFVGFDIDPDT